MDNETVNTNTQNGEKEADLSGLDLSALKELVAQRNAKLADLETKNRQLFERAKKAEGFEKQEDGSWVKIERVKSKDKSEDKKPEKSDDHSLLKKAYLRTAGIVDEDEVTLALETAQKWDVPIDKLVDDEDFKVKLGKLRDQKAIVMASSGAGGGQGNAGAKNTPEYWIAKGIPPSREQVPDRGTRAKIARAMMANQKSGKKFYND